MEGLTRKYFREVEEISTSSGFEGPWYQGQQKRTQAEKPGSGFDGPWNDPRNF
jgi:hypothetical protein